jgi:UDP-N-acetylmuramoylalanine--D-glutamate ligase
MLGEAIIGEIELAARFLAGHIVAITGANGKTTTTSLAGEIVAAGKFATLVGGNIGTAAISLVDRAGPATWTVLEVSSFQLETIVEFRPRIAVILNITPDHLDRHKTFDNYVNAKARVFENQRADDFTVLNAADSTTAGLSERTRAQLFWFSRKKEIEKGAFVRGERIYFRNGHNEREILPLAEVPLKGGHNLENVLAAVSIGMLVGCKPEQIRHAVRMFKAVEHRLEFVARVAEVDYYNDSKATNVDATIKALESFPANVHLILGGKDKGSDYTVLHELLRQRVKRVYTIGAAAAKIESQIQGAAEVLRAETLENAPASISSRAMNIAAECSRRRCIPWRSGLRFQVLGLGFQISAFSSVDWNLLSYRFFRIHYRNTSMLSLVRGEMILYG